MIQRLSAVSRSGPTPFSCLPWMWLFLFNRIFWLTVPIRENESWHNREIQNVELSVYTSAQLQHRGVCRQRIIGEKEGRK